MPAVVLSNSVIVASLATGWVLHGLQRGVERRGGIDGPHRVGNQGGRAILLAWTCQRKSGHAEERGAGVHGELGLGRHQGDHPVADTARDREARVGYVAGADGRPGPVLNSIVAVQQAAEEPDLRSSATLD